jgi:DNA-binding IclR family transcriptional regulator
MSICYHYITSDAVYVRRPLPVNWLLGMPGRNHQQRSAEVQMGKIKRRAESKTNAAAVGSATLGKGLQVLAAYATAHEARTSAEIAEMVGHPRPTVARLTATMVDLGYLTRVTRGRFEVAPRTLTLGYPVLSRLAVRQRARPLMREFSERVGGSVSIAVPSGLDYVLVETIDITNAMPHIPDIGYSSPIACTAIGRAVLAAMTQQQRDIYLERMKRLRPKEWRRHGEAVLASVAQCHEIGYCTIRDTWRLMHFGVASPLGRTARGEALAINCAMPSWKMSEEQLKEVQLGPRLVSLASDLRVILGLNPVV